MGWSPFRESPSRAAKRMRLFIPSFLFLAVAMVACTPKAQILESEGKVKSPGGKWEVHLTDSERGLVIFDRHAGKTEGQKELRRETGMRMTESYVSPNDWENFEGAFVYFDEDDRVWAWNGRDRTFIYERLPNSNRAWDIGTWPHKVPGPVRERLPENLLTDRKAEQAGRGNEEI